MNEKPILFSGEMVKAILDGSKTQTRRIGKIQGNYVGLGVEIVRHATKGHEAIATHDAYPGRGTARHGIEHCRFGVPGDRLWVKETFSIKGICHAMKPSEAAKYASKNAWIYAADGATGWKWKPSIFMPRAASRIALEITGVRVERLQDISRGDCMAEGCPFPNIAMSQPNFTDPKKWYSELWESINGKGSWDANPWVWVVAFKKISNGELSDGKKNV